MSKFSIGGEQFEMLNIDGPPRMTWPELKAVCSLAKVKLDQIDASHPEVLQALVLVSVKRNRPEFTMSDLDDVMLEVLDTLVLDEDTDASDPTEPGASTNSS